MMINIFVPPYEEIGYVWNADDWQKIREEFRITGLLCGSLSNYPRQDTYFSLPMCLSSEEMTLLKQKNLARLVRCPSLSELPNEETKTRFAEDEIVFQENQRQSYLKRKKFEVERSLTAIIKGRQVEEGDDQTDSMDQEKIISSEIDKIQSVSSGNYVNTLTVDPWIDENEFEDVDWTYPDDAEQRLKFDVFKDLWERKYYVTSGAKFGGDFLCYLGDPFKFHASFIVVCKEADAEIPCKDLIVAGRVGSYTKKTLVFASRSRDSVVYESLQWTGKPNTEESGETSSSFSSQ